MEEAVQLPEQEGLFDTHAVYQEASSGQRLLNFIVDNVLLRLVIEFVTGTMLIQAMLNIAPEFTYSAFGDGISAEGFLISYLFAVIHYIFYYTICEKAFKGYTLGKLISGTRAIRNDGQELTLKDCILRSLSRMVPFEVFSGLGSSCEPWHDTWTNTRVIKTR
jgi:uncharacterized RDD family membrane protein YckC